MISFFLNILQFGLWKSIYLEGMIGTPLTAKNRHIVVSVRPQGKAEISIYFNRY
jgi:hypothetical protein